ncbi:nudix hydrolase 14, chloroplastic isoform X2 [Telopea speciosissima]|uniref:nudix hydrolase 14, chloroplastic isoform X2 n=1 Tax=Telopea speciosissima TaxID=54955 RepID=UPI001CC5DB14|nr:nudix hydrolase 14, chloroplastic isoform X2 [Telopea speciosissima]
MMAFKLFHGTSRTSVSSSPWFPCALYPSSQKIRYSLSSLLHRRRIRICTKMSVAEHSPLSHTIGLAVPAQGGIEEPLQIIAEPGISQNEFRDAIESSLFKQWLKNMQSETGILAQGNMSLKRVLIQGVDMFGKRVGFLKFKADVIDMETGKKVEEETGIHLNLEDMANLTAFLEPSTGSRVFPSPGGCDEEISLFLYKGHVKPEVITALQGKETGLREHGELIKVHVVPYKKLWRVTADAKALMAIALYEMAKREGLLPS